MGSENNNAPASEAIATCYCPNPEPGRGQAGRLIELRRDNQHGDYTVSCVHNMVAEYTRRFDSRRDAMRYARDRGFTDVVYAAALTSREITDVQLRQLHAEASLAGDHEQMIICGIADGRYANDPQDRERELAGHAYHLLLSPSDYRRFGTMTRDEARQLCADAINAARAMED